MRKPRGRARVVVRTDDPALRSLIVGRLAAAGDLEVEGEAAPSGSAAGDGRGGPDAFIDLRDGDRLTRRETEVLALLAEGLANKEIASRLGFSVHTAKFHVDSILRKLSAANRAEAVTEGIRRGAIGI